MADISKQIRILSSEIIEILGSILKTGKPLDAATLSKGMNDRPAIKQFFENISKDAAKTDPESKKKVKELSELSVKHNEALKDLRHAEMQTQDIEDAFQELCLVLAMLSENPEEPQLIGALKTLKDVLKKKPVPSRIQGATKDLREFLYKLDTRENVDEALSTDTSAAEIEDAEDTVRDILVTLIEEFTGFENQKIVKAASDLVRRLSSDFTLDDFNPFVQEITELIFNVKDLVRRDREDLYNFSQEIMGKLEETENDLIRTLDENATHFETHETRFADMVANDMEEIEQSFSTHELSIETVRKSVLDRIASIREHFKEKQALDEVRIKQAEVEKSTIRRRLKSVHDRYQEFTRQSKTMIQQMEKFKKASLRDGLTGIFNRRAYDIQIKKALSDLKSGNIDKFSLIVFDVDKFKDFNNNHGHRVGDKILLHMARLVKETVRNEDFVARYGGDEFVVILPEAALPVGRDIAEKIRVGMSGIEFKLFKKSDTVVFVKLSLGVSVGRSDDSAADIFLRADKALYIAKENGRNQVKTEADI